MIQEYSSKDTSINKNKLPAIYKKLSDVLLNLNDYFLDYGCGKYVDHIKQRYNNMLGTDKYNYKGDQNKIKNKKFPVVLLSNVLNVIKEKKLD